MEPRHATGLDPTRTDDAAVVGGDGDCAHPTEARAYLGQMGVASFYRCTACDGAIVVW